MFGGESKSNLRLFIKEKYFNFISKKRYHGVEKCIYGVLGILSLAYLFIVWLRNTLYDKGILPTFQCEKKIISVGNISWGGRGKTTMVEYIHKSLVERGVKVASLTKGYAKDEFYLLKDRIRDVFDGKDRVSLVERLSYLYDAFILDDGFQYRYLKRDLDVVMLSLQDILGERLIPQGRLREPKRVLQRANIVVVISFNDGFKKAAVIEKIHSFAPNIKVFFVQYKIKRCLTIRGEEVDLGSIKNKNLGVLTAIGNPEGFIGLLERNECYIKKRVIYPDHFEFGQDEMKKIEAEFLNEGIEEVLITPKDYYHIDKTTLSLSYFIIEPEFNWDDENSLLSEIEKVIS